MILKNILRLVPKYLFPSLSNYRILSFEYGHLKTVKNWSCVDKNNNPIPWYTYPAIEYINQLDFTEKEIFEFGSGNSTIFWALNAKKVISVEDNREWFDKIEKQLPKNAEYLYINQKDDYINAIKQYSSEFDGIIIDGSHRYECALNAVEKLRRGGMIILDNSDWYEKTAAFLRDADLIEVDMTGFGPINGYTWTTSFFFHREFNFKPLYNRQPVHGIGSLKHRNDLKEYIVKKKISGLHLFGEKIGAG